LVLVACLITLLPIAPACSDGDAGAGAGPGAGDPGAGVADVAVFGTADLNTATAEAPADVPAREVPAQDAPAQEAGPALDALAAPDGVSASDAGDAGPEPDPGPCVPSCAGKECGADGCGGLCGSCTGSDLCTSAGTCDPDPTAGCAGLQLAEDWSGDIEGDAHFEILALFDLESNFEGTLGYSITCLNSKFIVTGTMSGVAEANAFTFAISGTYDPTTQKMKTTVADGEVFVFQVGTQFFFDGWLDGTLQADGTFAGQFDVQAVDAKNGFGPLDPATYAAWAIGTWTAGPAP
jgi:hypothetical protein